MQNDYVGNSIYSPLFSHEKIIESSRDVSLHFLQLVDVDRGSVYSKLVATTTFT